MDSGADKSARVDVVVRDVEMGFWSMVVFLVKLAFAAIPAGIILVITFALLAGMFSSFKGL